MPDTAPEPETDEPAPDLVAAHLDFIRGFGSSVDDVSPEGAARPWVVSKINTDAVDRFRTVILPGGMDKRDYEKDKVVLWEHGKDPARGKVPIGRNLWIKPGPGKRSLVAKTEFAADPFSRGLHQLYRDGFLRGWSVYGMPDKAPGKVGKPTRAELAARPELADCETVYRAWKLIEYSATPIPGNAECDTEEVSRSLADAVGKGLWIPESLRAVASTAPAPAPAPLPELVGRTFEDVMRSVLRQSKAEARAMAADAVREAREIARGRV